MYKPYKRNNIMIIVLCTLPCNMSIATDLAKTLVNNKLAACVSILNNIYSIYYWKNTLETNTEIQLLIKTKKILKEKIFLKIQELHPYKIPEILVLSVEDGETKYLSWIRSTLKN